MMITVDTIIHDDDPRIRTRSADVPLPLSAEDEELLRAMHKYVKDSQDEELAEQNHLQPAVGIAAIQLGIAKKMIAVVVEKDEESDWEFALVNPKIISRSKKMAYLESGEGCLSVPAVHEGYVPRHDRITVKAWDLLRNQEVVIKATGMLAIVLQHEIDHLSGTLYYDHINPNNPFAQIQNADVL